MKRPRYSDRRPRYRTAEESRAPGYLARRFEAIRRLQRMKEKRVVVPIRKGKPNVG